MTAFKIVERLSGTAILVKPGESILHAMERQSKSCIKVGCRSGGCGVCKIKIVDGEYDFGLMNNRFVGPEERLQGQALACRVFPRAHGTIEWAVLG